MSEKYDVFVGNLTFNTTEEQLREKFSFVGPVKNVRMLTDKETGKPKGFAFVEYFDTNTALSAIRHLDQTELNSRKIKVGYPAQSNLKDVARQIGQVHDNNADAMFNTGGTMMPPATRHQMEQSVVNSLKMHEAWDILEAMKKLVTEDNNRGHKARVVLETHPQLINALYEIQRKLGIALPKHVQSISHGPDADRQGSSSIQTYAGDVSSGTAQSNSIQQGTSRFSGNPQVSPQDYYQNDFAFQSSNVQNDYFFQSGNVQNDYPFQPQNDYPFQSGNNQSDYPFQSLVDQNGNAFATQGQFSMGQFGASQQTQLSSNDQLTMGHYGSNNYDGNHDMQFQQFTASSGVDTTASIPPYSSFDAPMTTAYGPQQGGTERRSRFGGKAVPAGGMDDYNQQFLPMGTHDTAQHQR